MKTSQSLQPREVIVMRVTTTLRAIEKSMEKEVLEFFQLLGASEAPEDWQAGDARYPVKNRGSEKKPAQPSDQENSSPH